MSSGTELLWPGLALLLLGLAASLCVRCSRPGAKRSEKIYEQRSLQESRQSFVVAQTYSLVGHPWPGPLADTVSDVAHTRNEKLLQFSPGLEELACPRYQNFSKGSRHGSDAGYIDPTAGRYYNGERFPKPSEDDDDTNSYENVLICKPRTSDNEECEDYQNSASIHQWRESRRVMEHVWREAPPSPGSPDEDGEPDYVNGDVAGEA
ncbi:PREDICTED: linker for activation of T-cells family member 2 isoform X2 [Propithecus coquereli]|uniref:linker for activation of T-cells family member 2 isoform X2 n=1 Tax=Propithecus coquereli TaxID=379532 RepID=UPI00063F4E68|nr:PREDICTED: linker for activation of T-cells family member 2 isoform X2 [Propithecus coquereli]XP_012495758.1 PREDICTED: linker for activation of T-cells family member 2 isoform X2 [Propithecus coquereli]